MNVIKEVENGSNIFLTGAAGTGKSYTINKIIEMFPEKRIALTALTGLAAVNISGQTLHSFLNLGMIKTNDINQEVNRIVYNPYTKWEHVLNIDILIIDECSMLDGFLFEIIEQVLRKIKGSKDPFGGMQIILVGDLFQLPPVQVSENGFFFESESYRIGRFKSVVLSKIYRQNDLLFINTLNRIRVGEQTNDDIEYLKQRQFPDLNYAMLDTTCLFATNQQVDHLNTYRLDQIDKKQIDIEAEDIDFSDQLNLVKRDFTKLFRAPTVLSLKKDCRVLLLKNVDVSNGICNGSVGKFKEATRAAIYCEFNGKIVKLERQTFDVHEKGKVVYQRSQFPIRLGYGITIHSSQGMTLDSVAIDFQRTFASGQGYVALSRARIFEGLYLKNIEMNCFTVNKKVVDFIGALK